jgi:hypothetical protein
MSISARVIADSISPKGKRITTFVLTYPRFVHSEFMTHRVFSRNAASSRAIPAKKIRASVKSDPAVPVFWGANQAGMQAQSELTGAKLFLVKLVWSGSMHLMLFMNWLLERAGLHKQIANRILEPWFNITVVCTATEWSNFYHLRNHEAAQPEIRELARVMLEAHNRSVPRPLRYGEWHLPFIDPSDQLDLRTAKIVSAARCARVSYLNHEGKRSSLEEDVRLFNRLLDHEPKHASPAEHQATPLEDARQPSGNLVGWLQNRKLFENENLSNYKGLSIQ